MGEAVPARIGGRGQAKGARDVDHARARRQRARRQLHRDLGRRAEKDQLDRAQSVDAVGLRRDDHAGAVARDRQAIAQALAGPLVAHRQRDREAGVRRQDPRRLHPRVAGDADRPRRSRGRRSRGYYPFSESLFIPDRRDSGPHTTRGRPRARPREQAPAGKTPPRGDRARAAANDPGRRRIYSSCGAGRRARTAAADRRSSSALAMRSSAIRSSNFPVTILRTTAAASDVAAMVSDNTSASGTRATVRERSSDAGVHDRRARHRRGPGQRLRRGGAHARRARARSTDAAPGADARGGGRCAAGSAGCRASSSGGGRDQRRHERRDDRRRDRRDDRGHDRPRGARSAAAWPASPSTSRSGR